MSITGKLAKKLTQAWLSRLPLTKLKQYLIRRGGATGLCYHAIAKAYPGYPYVTAPEAFETHLTFLTETFEIRPVREIARVLVAGHIPGASKPLAFLCFDDAYRDNLYTATPLLEKYGVPATMFAPRDLVQRSSRTHMSEMELKEIATHPLWEVGAHGITHNVLPALAPADIRTELHESRDWLANLTGAPVSGFAYPQGQICPDSISIVREFYDFAVTTNQRIGSAFDPLQIRRYCPTRQDNPIESLIKSLLLASLEEGVDSDLAP